MNKRGRNGIVEQARAIHKSLEEQQASEDDRMLRVFMLVYWLASEGLPMLKIYTLADADPRARLPRRYQLRVGRRQEVHQPHGCDGDHDGDGSSLA